MKQMKHFFKELDADKSGMIGVDEIEETLISLGLAKTIEDVEKIVAELDEDGNGELDFEEFMKLLKDTTSIADGNFLQDRNILFEKQKVKEPEIDSQQDHINPNQFFENLRQTDKALDMKEKDPRILKERVEKEKERQRNRKKIFDESAYADKNVADYQSAVNDLELLSRSRKTLSRKTRT